MFHVIVLLNPQPPSVSPLRTDLANLMVFYKDLNERFISENPTNTVSAQQEDSSSSCPAFLRPREGPIQAEAGNPAQAVQPGAPSPALSQPFCPAPFRDTQPRIPQATPNTCRAHQPPTAAERAGGDHAGGRGRARGILCQTLGAASLWAHTHRSC